MRRLPLLLGLLLAAAAYGQGVLDLPLTGRVMDRADVLSDATEATLAQQLEALEAQTSHQVVILTVPGLGGRAVEEVANGLFNAWGLGQAGRDNGVLLLVARDDRALRIEVGYGLEGALTDAEAGRIIRNVIVPAFRAGNFDAGVLGGAQAIAAEVTGEQFAGTPYSGVRALAGGDYFVLAIALVALLLAYLLARRFVRVAGGLWEGRRRFSFVWRAVVGGLLLGYALYTLGLLGEIVVGTPRPPMPWLLGLVLWPLAMGLVLWRLKQSPVWLRYWRRQARIEKQKQRARQQGRRVQIHAFGRTYWYDGRPAPPSSYSGSSGSSYSSSSFSSSSFSSSSFSGGGGSSGGGGASGSW